MEGAEIVSGEATGTGPVTIIGAGIIGVACALFLQRAGRRVTLVDRLAPGGGCSKGNCGGIATTEFMPLNKPGNLLRVPGWLLDPQGPLSIRWRNLPRLAPYLYQFLKAGRPSRVAAVVEACAPLSRATWDDFNLLLKDAGLEDEIVNDFCLTLYDSDRDLAADQGKWDACDRLGFRYEKLAGPALRELEPDLAPDFAWGFINCDWRNARDPEALVQRLADQVQRQGGTIERGEVAAIDHDESRATALRLADGRSLPVDHLVIAAGAWSARLTRQFGLKLPLEADRGYNTTIPDPGVKPSRQITYPAGGLAITPLPAGLRVGGSVELAGLDAPPDYRRSEAQIKRARRVYPKLRAETAERWMGHRPSMPDSLPVIGPAPGFSNIHLAFGHGHLGLTWGPTTGRLMAEMIAGGAASIDMTPYRADRF